MNTTTDIRASAAALGSPAPVAVLFCRADSVYKTLPGCDVFDADRDARTFQGGMPVVAHPPCARWGRYWGGTPTQWPRLKLGDDGGCFEVALRCVRGNGGVKCICKHCDAKALVHISARDLPEI